MFKPMPSPRGTNYAQLFIPARGPVAAYDAKEGLETRGGSLYPRGGYVVDASTDDGMQKIAKHIAEKIGVADLPKLIEALNAINMENTPDTKGMSFDRRMAGLRMDTELGGFYSSFPNASKIGVV